MNTGSGVAVGASAADLPDMLTVVLTLKGRESWTPRWIDYHSRVGLPWPVIIGDGAPSDQTESLFARASALRTEYHRYDDQDFLAYYRKLHDLVAKVRTRYVILTDNDDFVMPDGVARCVRFLGAHPEYVSCSGEIAGIFVTDDALADSDRINGGYVWGLKAISRPMNLIDDDAEKRATGLLRNYVATWYAVHRRDALLKAFADLVERKISDVAVMELLIAAELAAQGKQKIDIGYVSYLRQLNSSQGAYSVGGLFKAPLAQSVVREVGASAESIAAIVAGKEHEEEAVTRIRAAIMSHRDWRMAPRGLEERARRFARRYFHTLRAKVPFLRPLFDRFEMRNFIAGLRAHGAHQGDVASLLRDLDLVWGSAGAFARRKLTHTAAFRNY